MSKLSMSFTEINCILTPLTSIHIGDGKELTPYEYVIKGNEYFRIDCYSIFEKLDSQEQLKFTTKIEEGIVAFRTYLRDLYKEEYGYIYKGVVDSKFLRNYNEKIKGSRNFNESNQLLVSEFIGSLKGKYIPGSTIKGAMRGAYMFSKGREIFNYPLIRNKKIRTMPIVYDPPDRKVANYENEKYESRILNIRKKTPFNDPFKFVTIKDTEMCDMKLAMSHIERVSRDKNGDLKEQAPTYVERVLGSVSDGVEQELKFKISIKDFGKDVKELMLNSFNKKSRDQKDIENIEIFDITTFIDCLNEKFGKVLEDEIRYFERARATTALLTLKELKKELESCKEDGESAIIRIGKGSGFTTFTHILNNKFVEGRKDLAPSSRILTEKGCSMGWAKIKFEVL